MPCSPALRRAAGRASLGAAVAVLASGCTLPASDRTPSADPAPVRELPPADALDALGGLPRTDRDPGGPAYDRGAFGPAWSDVDGNGCNQRDDVLLRDAEPGSTTTTRQGGCAHDVLAGTWVDPYTGARLVMTDMKDPAQAQAVQIDHVVPLAEAWRSGASGWSAARREAFANDLGVLAAADGPTNAAKGDDDPAAWLPRARFQCAYVLRWVAVKDAWDLAVDDSEDAALRRVLAQCP